MNQKKYEGKRVDNSCTVTVDDKPLRERNDLQDSQGFNWGYSGGGPQLLAVSLAADIFGDEVKAFPLWYTVGGIKELIKGIESDQLSLTEPELKEAGIKTMLGLTQPPKSAGRQYKQEAREFAIKSGYGHLAILAIT